MTRKRGQVSFCRSHTGDKVPKWLTANWPLVLLLCVAWAGFASASDNPSPLVQSLELAQWDESRFAKLVDGEPLTIDERLELYRLVRRLTDFDRRLFATEYAQPVTAANLRERPHDYRGKLVLFTGRAVRVEQTPLPPDEQQRFGFAAVYDALAIDGTGTAILSTAAVPRAWLGAEQVETPAVVSGVFFKLVPLDEEEVAPLIAAPRIAWYPADTERPRVTFGMALLGQLGVDVAQLDAVEHGRSLSPADAPAFYDMLRGLREIGTHQLVRGAERHLPQHEAEWREALAAAKQAADAQRQNLARVVLKHAAEGRYSVAPFFNDPHHQVGRLAVFDGVVRRAVRIVIDDASTVRSAATDHYFELELFTDDSQNLPLVFCVRELPPDFPLGEDLREPVRIAGFFLKSWRFRTRRDSPHAERTFPLFLGRAPLRIVEPEPSTFWGWILGLGFVALVALVWLAQWRLARADRNYSTHARSRRQIPQDPPEPNVGDDR